MLDRLLSRSSSFPQLSAIRRIREVTSTGQDLVLHITPHKKNHNLHAMHSYTLGFCKGLIKQDNDLGGYFRSARKYFLTPLAATVLDLGRLKSGIEVMCSSECVCVCECVCLCFVLIGKRGMALGRTCNTKAHILGGRTGARARSYC